MSEDIRESFRTELGHLINRHSQERYSNTPDFILACFMDDCLMAFSLATRSRDSWYGIEPVPGTDWLDAAHERRKVSE